MPATRQPKNKVPSSKGGGWRSFRKHAPIIAGVAGGAALSIGTGLLLSRLGIGSLAKPLSRAVASKFSKSSVGRVIRHKAAKKLTPSEKWAATLKSRIVAAQ